jgi:hypothetical protein
MDKMPVRGHRAGVEMGQGPSAGSAAPFGRERAVARLGLVRLAVSFGLVVVAQCELLGLLRAFARGPLVVAWLAVGAVVGFRAARGRRGDGGLAWRPSPRPPPLSRDPVALFAIATIAVILLASLVTALLSPPNNWDVLIYHLPRVRHWIQNRGFAHFPTHCVRQNSYAPGGGYFVAQLALLSGGDRLASLPQWGAFAGAIAVVAGLARRLGGRRAVVPAALACATLPMGLLQASNAQTDLVAAFWFTCFVSLVFERPRHRVADAAWLGAALGLGLATKPTAAMFAAPFGLLLAARALRPDRGSPPFDAGQARRLGLLALVGLVAVLPVLPSAVRNVRTFGRPLGPDLGVSLARKDARAVGSNLLRNAALNLPSAGLWRAVRWSHDHLLHIDADDPATTIARTRFDPKYIPDLGNPDENFAASPAHVAAGIMVAIAALRGRRRGERAGLRAQLVVGLALGWILYCAALRWQPWANRLVLPLFVAATPLIGWGLAAAPAAGRAAVVSVMAVLGILLSLTSIRHPLIPLPPSFTEVPPAPSVLFGSRDDLVFATYGAGLRGHYEELGRQLSADGCRRVGIVGGEFDPEYLVWLMAERRGGPAQIRGVAVENDTRRAAPELPGVPLCGLVRMQPGWWGLRAPVPTGL